MNTHFPAVKRKNKDVYKWTNDDDFDDFFQDHGIYKKPSHNTRLSARENADSINYRIIVSIILSCLNNTPLTEDDTLIDFLEEAENDSNYKGDLSPLDQQISNIYYLYNHLKKEESAHKHGITSPLIIYRGFTENRYNKLFNIPLTTHGKNLTNIKKGEIITIPTFLSTSILRNTALRFVTPDYYFWEIIIPTDKLHIFKYVYLGDYVNLNDLDNQLTESEILLNIGTQLKFVSEKKSINTIAIPWVTGETKILEKSCIVQTFEFVGYDNEVDLSYLDDCLQGNNHKKMKLDKGKLMKKKSKKSKGKKKLKKKSKKSKGKTKKKKKKK